jgi:hypothetical protein
MPRVMVTTDAHDGHPSETLLDEFVDPVHLESEHSAGTFVERLGWAIVDAQQEEPPANGRPR